MKRLYFISPSLIAIEQAEHDLVKSGIKENRLHLLSDEIAEAQARNLHPVSSLARIDLFHWLERGVIIGFILAITILLVTYLTGLNEQYTWFPFTFIAVFVMAFSTWEAGLIGVQSKNYKFELFEANLENGEHVLYVDCNASETNSIKDICINRFLMKFGGTGDSLIHPFSDPTN